MNGHQQRHNPHSPLALLYTHSSDGRPAPEGWAWNSANQLCRIAPTQPYMTDPAVPWESFDNKDFVALHKGEASIEMVPGTDPTAPPNYGRDPMGSAVPPLSHANVALIPNEAYNKEQDDPDEPVNEVGTTAIVHIGERGMVGRANWDTGRPIVGYVQVPSPDADFALTVADPTQPNPLNVPPVQAAIDSPPVGGCVSISKIGFGHEGGQFESLFDVPGGQIIHLPFSASYGRVDALLAPKYYHPGTEAVTGFRNYFLFPGGPVLSSAHWNTLSAQVLPQNNFTGLSANGVATNPNAIAASGWFSFGNSFTNTSLATAVRRFYGSCLCTGTPPNPIANPIVNAAQVTVCPIAWYASQVTLVSNPGLNFIVRGLTPSGGGPQMFWGPFPANQPIQLPAGAVDILVFQVIALNQPGVARIEILFEIDSLLSW